MVNPPCTPASQCVGGSTVILSGNISGLGSPGPIAQPILQHSLNITPTVGRHYLMYVKDGATIQCIRSLVQGTLPSVTFNVGHGANFNGIGADLFAADVVASDTATGNGWPAEGAFVAGSVDVAADTHVWVDIATVTGTVANMNLTVFYTAPAAEFTPPQWTSGLVVPATGTGNPGDMFLHTTTGDIYQRAAGGSWTLIANIKGPTSGQVYGASIATPVLHTGLTTYTVDFNGPEVDAATALTAGVLTLPVAGSGVASVALTLTATVLPAPDTVTLALMHGAITLASSSVTFSSVADQRAVALVAPYAAAAADTLRVELKDCDALSGLTTAIGGALSVIHFA